MDIGIFMMPLHPTTRTTGDVYAENLQKILLADQLGMSEAWVGQHFTASTEPIPSPLMFLAWALGQTKSIKLGTGVLNLPCFHPGVVAAEVAQFDHMSRGRLLFGIGTGALQQDFDLFQVHDPRVREERLLESISAIQQIWNGEPPYRIDGKYWTIDVSTNIDPEIGAGFMLKPFQTPSPQIFTSILSPFSSSATKAALRGWKPISSNFVPPYIVASHWTKYLEGCEAAGVAPDPENWRVARNIFVAETDREAEDLVFNKSSGCYFTYDYLWNTIKKGKNTIAMKANPKQDDDTVTVEQLIESTVIYGSPATVAEKIKAFRGSVGPFGTLLLTTVDWGNDYEGERRSMELLANKVLPALN